MIQKAEKNEGHALNPTSWQEFCDNWVWVLQEYLGVWYVDMVLA